MSESGARRTPTELEQAIIRDGKGQIQSVAVRVSCAEVVLSRAGEAGEIVMPAHENLFASLAEIRGEFGGPLNRAYDIAARTFREAGFRVREDPSIDVVTCTKKNAAQPLSCDISTCPWSVSDEDYAPDECPLDRWRSMEALR